MRDNKQQVHADNNQGTIFANTYDIKDLNVTYRQIEAKFSDFPMDDYDEKKHVVPQKAAQLVRTAKKERFHVLGGEGYQKDELSKFMAWKLFSGTPGVSNIAKVWINSTDPQNFDVYLEAANKPTIFILRDISPQNINNDLAGLYKITKDKNHYLIVTTNSSREKWMLEGNVKRLFWQPDSTEALYRPLDLQRVLTGKLNQVKHTLPEGLRGRTFNAGGALLQNLSLNEVVLELKSPQSIDIFVLRLTGLKKDAAYGAPGDRMPMITEAGIRKIIKDCRDDKRRLRHWYHVGLSSREKLIAMGLCLFDGFYDDQFFAAMNVLVEHSWHKREPSLKGLDYCDLESLSHYYTLNSQDGNGRKRVESHHPGLRKKFLEVVWDSHRRQILSALPVMERLVSDSVGPGSLNRELYGTPQQCSHLREEISDTLCCIGLKPENSIEGTVLEETLLGLASQEDIEVQTVVARAIARWRAYNQDEKLFETIQRWQDKAPVWDWNDDDTDEQSRGKKKPETYIKATVALTVGFAALYDQPNEMNHKLCDLLKQLAEDTRNGFILQRFSESTLPMVARLHVNQLRDILKEMTRHLSLDIAIGKSLASAYDVNPLVVVEILDAWVDEYKRNRPTHFSDDEISHYEAILATAAIAYGWMQYDKENGPITIEDGFRRLKTILSKEISTYVRGAALYAVILQMLLNFERAEEHIKSLFAVMHKTEIQDLIKQLVDVHLMQRIKFETGDATFEWREEEYKVWIFREQPLTTIETMIKKWMMDGHDQITRKIALQFNFARDLVDFRREEETFINLRKEELKKWEEQKEKNKRENSTPTFEEENHGDTVFIFFASWLATLKRRENLDIVRGLLPIVLKQNIADRDILGFVLKRMHKSADHDINVIAEQLESALSIMKKRGIILFLFFLSVAAAVYMFVK